MRFQPARKSLWLNGLPVSFCFRHLRAVAVLCAPSVPQNRAWGTRPLGGGMRWRFKSSPTRRCCRPRPTPGSELWDEHLRRRPPPCLGLVEGRIRPRRRQGPLGGCTGPPRHRHVLVGAEPDPPQPVRQGLRKPRGLGRRPPHHPAGSLSHGRRRYSPHPPCALPRPDDARRPGRHPSPS
jgi:hypothetical protein